MDAVLYDNKSNCCFTISKDKVFLIGRGRDVNFQASSPEVSRLQCTIKFNEEHWTITNLGKNNPTLLNGISIESTQFLKSKDIITIAGSYALEVVFFEDRNEIPTDPLKNEGTENYKRILFENQVLSNEVIQSRKRVRSISNERDSFEREVHRLRREKEIDKNTIKDLKLNLIDTTVELDNVVKDYNKAIEEKNNATSVANLAVLKAIEIDILKKDLSEAIDLAKQHESEKNEYKNMLENRGAVGTNDTEIISRALDQELSCCVCNEVLYKAVGLSCGHTLCKYCLQKWKEQKKECPMCRMPIKAEVPCLSLDSFIETFAPFLGNAFNSRREELKLERQADEAKTTPARGRGGRRGGRRTSNLSIQLNPIDLTSSPMTPIAIGPFQFLGRGRGRRGRH